MTKTRLHQLTELGQSAWLDYISRELLDSGKLSDWIKKGLRGMTSNPAIFNQVISQGTMYDAKIAKLKEQGKSTFEIYDTLTIADIKDACNLFAPLYRETKGLDGYVSLEINPQLANDAAASIVEGKRLYKEVAKPNVMIKVPATVEGFPVIEELLASGINVNVTLIFSIDQYIQTVQAYFRGLERLAKAGGDLTKIRSVASVFVSRIDTTVDKLIEEQIAGTGDEEEKKLLRSLQGKAAIANCKLIFQIFKELFASEKFKALEKKGAPVQRVLWGSTSTKNPAYRDVKYVEELIASPTVNTIPENTLIAFVDHGEVKEAMMTDIKEAEKIINTLIKFDISVPRVCRLLLEEGVVAFIKSFENLLKAVETKATQLCHRS